MRSPFGNPEVVSREIGGQFRPGTDKIVSRKIGPVCKVIWPVKTAAHVATIIEASERHAARILAGEFDAPGALIAAIIVEITKKN